MSGPETPLARALSTTSVGRRTVTSVPPIGDRGTGAPRVTGATAGAARCVSVTAVPATASAPVRSAPVFAATENCTEPFADPLDPWLIVMNAALLVAVQEQPLPAVTVIVPVPPSGPK